MYVWALAVNTTRCRDILTARTYSRIATVTAAPISLNMRLSCADAIRMPTIGAGAGRSPPFAAPGRPPPARHRLFDPPPLERHHHAALVFEFVFQPDDQHRVVHSRHFADVPPRNPDLLAVPAVHYQDFAPRSE